jgi:uncharacterized damage-inducible protein DinB
MTRMDEIRDLYAYNRWANRRVLDAAARLSPEELSRDLGSSFPSVRETLAHVLAGEWIWLTRWRGSSPPGLPESWDLSSLEVVRAQWAEVEADQRAFVEGLDEAALDRVVAYRDTRGDPYENPLGQLLRHVVNHSTYHRGQVVTMLRQLGADAVATDYVVYLRERAG